MIHPTAIIHPGAKLADGVSVGPNSIIEGNVSIGEGTKIGANVVIEGWTTLGEKNEVYHHVVLGTPPQDLKFKGEKSCCSIGAHNVIREFVTINRGTAKGGARTVIGNNNLLMAYAHVAHDSLIGDNVILSNAATLGGHVQIEDFVVLSGLAGIHHFVTIGKLTIIGGCSKVTADIPPFLMADGHPAKVHGLNVIGLKRQGFSPKTRQHLKKAYHIIYLSGLNTTQALKRIEREVEQTPEIVYLTDFIKRTLGGKSGRAKQP